MKPAAWPVAWTWNAALICPDCGDRKPERDREGNERAPVYSWDASDSLEACDLCREPLDCGLTREGLARLADEIGEADARLPLPPLVAHYARAYRHDPRVRDLLALRDRIQDEAPENKAREPGAEGVGSSE